jgi:poly(A) polymerase Pap1
MLTLKLWAKQHFVAGDQFGLLNGTTLTLMFVHIFLQHPKATVPSLLGQFFDTYSRW